MHKYRVEQENIITKDIELFCFFDESLKALGVKTPKNSIISYADVLLITYHAFIPQGFPSVKNTTEIIKLPA